VESEGTEKREQDIPIVIREDNVLEWLCERHVVARSWTSQASAVRKSAKTTDFLALCDRMEDLLKRTPDQSRGLFGGYNNAQLAECEAALTSYRKGRKKKKKKKKKKKSFFPNRVCSFG
jgi:hypothetical protein